MKKLNVWQYAQLKGKTRKWIYDTIKNGTFSRYFPDAKIVYEQKQVIKILTEEDN